MTVHCHHWMTIPKFWPKPIPRHFSDTKFSEPKTDTFFPRPNFPKPKPRLFSETKFFRNRNRNFFSETKFSETETLKYLAKVSKPRSFETEMSISACTWTSWGKQALWQLFADLVALGFLADPQNIIVSSKTKIVKGILHQKIFYRLNLIFWIVMGCGIARFGRRGLKTTETWKFWSQGLRRGAPGVWRHSAKW